MSQKSWLKEPFIHFVLLGFALFVFHGFWVKTQSKDTVIHIETAEMERQALIFAGENRREPTDADLKALLYSYIEEEVLVREALIRKLDEGDTIIRRRLAQKMRFLIEDISTVTAPTDAELKAWFEPRRSNYRTLERLSLTHIYFSPEKHGDDVLRVANSVLNDILSGKETRDVLTLGDPFMLQKQFKNVTQRSVEHLLGSDFSDAVFEPSKTHDTENGWLGVVTSAFGAHIVRVDDQTPMQEADFERVKEKVREDWTARKIREQNKAALKALMDKYEVKVEGVDE